MATYEQVKAKYDEVRRKYDALGPLVQRSGSQDWFEIYQDRGEQLDRIRDAYISTGRLRFDEALAGKSDEVLARLDRLGASIQQSKDHLQRLAARSAAAAPPPSTPPPPPARFATPEKQIYDLSREPRFSLSGAKRDAFVRMLRSQRGSLKAVIGAADRLNKQLAYEQGDYDGVDAAGWSTISVQADNLIRIAREGVQSGKGMPYWDDLPVGYY